MIPVLVEKPLRYVASLAVAPLVDVIDLVPEIPVAPLCAVELWP
jgi:hypothetical protein